MSLMRIGLASQWLLKARRKRTRHSKVSSYSIYGFALGFGRRISQIQDRSWFTSEASSGLSLIVKSILHLLLKEFLWQQ